MISSRDICRLIDSFPNSVASALRVTFFNNPNALFELYTECHEKIFVILQNPIIARLILKYSPAFILQQVENNNSEMLIYHYWAMSFYHGVVTGDMTAMNDNIDEAIYYLEELTVDEPSQAFLSKMINFPYKAYCYLIDEASKSSTANKIIAANNQYEQALTYSVTLIDYIESLSTKIPYTLDGNGKTLSLFKLDTSLALNLLGMTSLTLGRAQLAQAKPYEAITTLKYGLKCFDKSFNFSKEFDLNPKALESRKLNIGVAHNSIALCHQSIQLKLESKLVKTAISDEIYHLKCSQQFFTEITSTSEIESVLAQTKSYLEAAAERYDLAIQLQELETNYIQKARALQTSSVPLINSAQLSNKTETEKPEDSSLYPENNTVTVNISHHEKALGGFSAALLILTKAHTLWNEMKIHEKNKAYHEIHLSKMATAIGGLYSATGYSNQCIAENTHNEAIKAQRLDLSMKFYELSISALNNVPQSQRNSKFTNNLTLAEEEMKIATDLRQKSLASRQSTDSPDEHSSGEPSILKAPQPQFTIWSEAPSENKSPRETPSAEFHLPGTPQM